MQYLLFTGPNGYTNIYGPITPEQVADLISQLNLSSGDYALLDNLDALPEGWETYPWGVTFTPPTTAGYDFTLAQLEAKTKVAVTYTVKTNNVATSVPTLMLSSQMALPEGDRLPAINETINALNSLAIQMQSYFEAIDAATNIQELNAIVNPPTGIINIGRGQFGGPLDLNESNYVEFNSDYLTEAETELYVPGTNIVIGYGDNPPGEFNSGGPCFNEGDYRIQIRVASTSAIIAEFEVPLSVDGSNQNISF